jgi:hypothetical protein
MSDIQKLDCSDSYLWVKTFLLHAIKQGTRGAVRNGILEFFHSCPTPQKK